MGFTGSDLWKVRQKWGNGPLVWPGVTVVVTNRQGLVWMGKRLDNQQWSIVGGYYELGDGAEDCARREVREELGLEIVELTMIGVITDAKLTHITYPNGDQIQSPSHVFTAIVDGEAHQDDEHSDHKWVPFDEALGLVGEWGYSGIALRMRQEWLTTKQFQIA